MEPYLKELENYLGSAVLKLKQDLQGIRSGRPTTQLLENIKAEYAGSLLPLKQLGSLTVKPPREIDITVWDQEAVPPILKAIQDATIGLSVSREGNMIRAVLPPLTEERRAELTKIVKKMAEETRIMIRTHRDDVQKKIKSAEARKELSENQVFASKGRIQKIIDNANAEIEKMIENKLKELYE